MFITMPRASCSHERARTTFVILLTLVVGIGCSSDATTAAEPGSESQPDADPSDEEQTADADDEAASVDASARADASRTRLDAASSPPDASGIPGQDARASSTEAIDASAPERADAATTAMPVGDDCTNLPATADYEAKGPFEDAKMFERVGPSGGYLLYRPDGSLGRNGFKHPLAVWGNGIATTADQYKQLLTHVASHGFVVIACPDTRAERDCLYKGMEWLVQQNVAPGPLQGKLDVMREATIGYSWGGGAAIDTANRPNVKATVSLHGMPPRRSDAFTTMNAPLLLFTSTGDTFVNAEGYVTPNYNKSTKVPTFYATLLENVGHLYVIDEGAVSCAVDGVLGGPCAGAAKERAPTVAFLRHFVCGDREAKKYFFGADCTLCTNPWKAQSKPAPAWQ